MHPQEPLRVGLLGAGGITRVHVPAWLELGADIGVYALAGAEALAAEYPQVRVFSSRIELLAWCTVVDICTPTPTHLECAIAAIEADKHVVCEKPVARTLAEATLLSEFAAEHAVTVYPAHVVRFFPQYAAAKAAIEAGELGLIGVARFNRTGELPRWSPWFLDERASGGLIMDLMIHDLDIARWMLGEVHRVFARKTRAQSGEISASVTLSHEGGGMSVVNGIWGARGTRFTTGFHLAGTGGVLNHSTAHDSGITTNLATGPGGGAMLPDLSLHESPYLTELREFLTHMRGGPAARVTLADGVRAVQLAEAANESAALGVPVPVPVLATFSNTAMPAATHTAGAFGHAERRSS